ncbi:MAG: hypothetical protein ACYTFO_11555, partial [Planctomycetota bacterium]
MAVLIVAGGAAVGDERTERAFRAMFAADLERVAETSSLDDDVALAARMVRVARAGRADTALLETLCEHALTLVETAESGRSVARDAEDLLIETSPELAAALWARRAETLKRRLATAPRQQRTRIAEQLVDVLLSLADVQSGSGRGGDAEATLSEAAAVASTGARHRQSQIESARTRLAARIAATDELERALRRLESDPSDSQVCRRVVELYVIMMDDPASAAEYVDQAGDEVLATYVPLAAAPVSTIPAAAAMELGQWYLQLAADADAIWQRALLRRAQRSLASAGGDRARRRRGPLGLHRSRAGRGFRPVASRPRHHHRRSRGTNRTGTPYRVGGVVHARTSGGPDGGQRRPADRVAHSRAARGVGDRPRRQDRAHASRREGIGPRQPNLPAGAPPSGGSPLQRDSQR